MARLETALTPTPGFFGQLRFGAIFVQPRHGKPALARNLRRALHGDEAIGIARIAHDQDADIRRGVFLQGAALASENFAIDGQQILALHARLARNAADEQCPMNAAKTLLQIRRGGQFLHGGRGAIFQFHDHPLQNGQRLGDVHQVKNHGLIGAKDFAGNNAKQNGIADGARRAGYRNTNGSFIHNSGCVNARRFARWQAQLQMKRGKPANVLAISLDYGIIQLQV